MTSSNTYFLLFFFGGGGGRGEGGVLTIKKRNQITLSNDKQQFETQQIESIVPSFSLRDVTRNSLVIFT